MFHALGCSLRLVSAAGVHSLLCPLIRCSMHEVFVRTKLRLLLLVCALILVAFSPNSAPAQTAPAKPLTIETLYQPGGLAGRGPENVEWSPDGTQLSFLQHQDNGEKRDLWHVDLSTGEKKILVSAEKMAALAPDINSVQHEREK